MHHHVEFQFRADTFPDLLCYYCFRCLTSPGNIKGLCWQWCSEPSQSSFCLHTFTLISNTDVCLNYNPTMLWNGVIHVLPDMIEGFYCVPSDTGIRSQSDCHCWISSKAVFESALKMSESISPVKYLRIIRGNKLLLSAEVHFVDWLQMTVL